jgi:hypothetical protein
LFEYLAQKLIIWVLFSVQRSREALVEVMNVEAAAASVVAELQMHFGLLPLKVPPASDSSGAVVTASARAPPLLLLRKAAHAVHLALRRRAAEAAEARALRGIEEATGGSSQEMLPWRLQDHSSYFCSHLVADVLAETRALHLNAAMHSHHMLPADFSSSARSPGASLWMNCGKGHAEMPYNTGNVATAGFPAYPKSSVGGGPVMAGAAEEEEEEEERGFHGWRPWLRSPGPPTRCLPT